MKLLSHVRLFATPWTAALQASLSITNSRSQVKLMSIESVSDAIQPSYPLSSPSSPTLNLSQHESFQMSQFFASGGQSIGASASASVLPMNTQDCSLRNYAAAAKSFQLCLTLCDPRDCSPPGSPVPGILQARTLEWVAISFSNA